MAKLTIYRKGSDSDIRCEVNKWEFQDKAMGEQFVMFTIESPVPIPFAVGDWCEFRGQTYTLNVEPSCTQKSGIRTHGAAFVYESVKFNSPQDDLTRCMMLDVIPTSGEHSAAYGTNYTGSANFTLNCFETTFVYQGQTIYYAPVHALLDRIKANLDRLYPGDPQDPDTCWQIYIDDSKCHSDDKIITFSNWTAAQALAEVHNSFKLDYVVRGKKIIVGDISAKYPELKEMVGYVTDLTEQDQPVFFGYGKGYLSEETPGKSLFQIKKLSKNDQQIVTRLRAVGSTKNMPYRYYHTHYTLPQTMYVQNLQLPDTFVPYDRNEDYPDNVDAPHCKVDGNAERDVVYGEGTVRHVLGRSNDAYIDKNDDAASCPEGIREGTARWDGSDGELPEIYPTIEEANYRELRAANVPDMEGHTGSGAYPHYLPYGENNDDERIDEILEPGEHCNEGNGVMTESEAFGMTTVTVPVHQETDTMPFENATKTIGFFNITTNQEPGDYTLAFTTQYPQMFVELTRTGSGNLGSYRVRADVTAAINVYQTPADGSTEALIGNYSGNATVIRSAGDYGRSADSASRLVITVPDFHGIEGGWSSDNLTVTKQSTIRAVASFSISVYTPEGTSASNFGFKIGVRRSDQINADGPNAIWQPSGAALYYSTTPFHLRIKDIGVDFTALSSVDGGDIILSMKSGQCAGREFVVKSNGITRYQQTSTGKWGWDLELDRVNDESIHAYFPSEASQIKAGDQYVLLGIVLPDAYIKAAEMRLLVAATNHLADNCDTKYTYQPSVDDIYLQRNIDFHASDPENSVFWRLYAGMKFPFYGIPREEGDPLPIADITIDSVSIRMGEKPTPQVDITLNDKLDQSMMQRLQTSVDRLYGSVFSHGGVVYSSSNAVSDAVVRDFGKNYFLSKVDDDTAKGNITFEGNIDAQSLINVATAYVSGNIGTKSFDGSFGGDGWKINSEDNSMTLDELTVRKTMRIFELLIQKVRATGGEIIVSPANGKVKSVSEKSNAYVVELESDADDNFGNMFTLYDYVRCQRWDSGNNSVHYYWAMVTASNGNTIELNKSHFDAGVMPRVGDELVLFGNYMYSSRQSAITITASEDGKPRITILSGIGERSLVNCTRAVLGDLSSVSDSAFGGTLEGYGLYSDNAYLKGKLVVSDGVSSTEIGAGYFNLKDGVTGAGIDLENGTLTLKSDKTTFKNSQGDTLAVFTDDGIQSSSLQCVDSEGNIRTVIDINGTRMYYPLQEGQTEQQVMKEEIFLFDTSTGSVTGTETRYYDINGNLLWRVGQAGEFEKDDITVFWTVEQGWYQGNHSIDGDSESKVKRWVDLATGGSYSQGETATYHYSEGKVTATPFNTTGVCTNCFLSRYTNTETTSQWYGRNGDYAFGDATESSPVAPSSAEWLTGWIMLPLNASTNSNGKYVRRFRHYLNGKPSIALVRGTENTSSAEYTKELAFVFDPSTGTVSVTYYINNKGILPH